VTYIAEECRFCAIDFGECLGALSLLLVGACVSNAGGNLARNQIQKSSVADVQRAVWIQRRNDHSGRRVLRLAGYWQENRTRGRFAPHSAGHRLKPFGEILNEIKVLLVENLLQRPSRVDVVEVDCLWRLQDAPRVCRFGRLVVRGDGR
jgi:hypothetical protein